MAAQHAQTFSPLDDRQAIDRHRATPWEASEYLWGCVAAVAFVALIGIVLLSGVRDSTAPVQNAALAPVTQQHSVQAIQSPATSGAAAETTGQAAR